MWSMGHKFLQALRDLPFSTPTNQGSDLLNGPPEGCERAHLPIAFISLPDVLGWEDRKGPPLVTTAPCRVPQNWTCYQGLL